MTNGNWRLEGVCRDEDPEKFFPNATDRRAILDATAVCFTCPVMAQCRQWAQDTKQGYGIWGGKNFGLERIEEDRGPRPEAEPDAPARPVHNGEKTHCKWGHPFNQENTRYKETPRGVMRQCKTCERHMQKNRYTARKAKVERQQRVQVLAEGGLSTRAIARELGINPRTVERDRSVASA